MTPVADSMAPSPPTGAERNVRPSGRPGKDPFELVIGAILHRRMRPILFDFRREAEFQTVSPWAFFAHIFPSAPIQEYEREFQEVLGSRPFPPERATPYRPITGISDVEGLVYYSLIRQARPEIVVETGVANGRSSTFMLEALERNGHGRLISIDIAADVGALIPAALRSRWELRVLPTRGKKPAFRATMGSIPPIDVFVHDSDHSYGWQWLEYEEAWRRMTAGGFLLADDADSCYALLDFARAQNSRTTNLVTEKNVLGSLRKPIA